MAVEIKRHTVEAFDEFINLPENADRLFEYIEGEIVEAPSNPYSSEIASNINFFIKLFLREQGVTGHVTGEAGGYIVSGERYAPDVAFISRERQPELAHEGYNPNPPELAVEVISPSDQDYRLRIKVTNYILAGTTVWVVNPQTKEVEVYIPGQPVRIVGIDGTLDGGDALPGFALAVKDVFPADDAPGESEDG